jgi:hypothetical protein
MTEKRGRGGSARKHEPHRNGPESPAHPPPGLSSHRQPCVAGLKSRSGSQNAPSTHSDEYQALGVEESKLNSMPILGMPARDMVG